MTTVNFGLVFKTQKVPPEAISEVGRDLLRLNGYVVSKSLGRCHLTPLNFISVFLFSRKISPSSALPLLFA
jgi:hypothetical protein